MKIVLDTNVVVSALLQPLGPSGQILAAVLAGEHQACFDDRIMEEYVEVLARPRFGFDQLQVEVVLDQIKAEGLRASCTPLNAALPDPDDEQFLEVAAGAQAEYVITGNLRDYPEDRRQGIRVVSPREFLTLTTKTQQG